MRSLVSEPLAEIQTMKKTFLYPSVAFFTVLLKSCGVFTRIRIVVIQLIQAREAARLPRRLRLLKVKT